MAASRERFSVSSAAVRNLGGLSAKILSAGKDHSLLVGEGAEVFLWGKNSEGQLGMGHARELNEICAHSSARDPVRAAVTREGQNYLVTAEGRVLHWPQRVTKDNEREFDEGVNLFRPNQLDFPLGAKIVNVSAGTDFAVFLAANGLLFAFGENAFGELGLGDRRRRDQPTLLSALKDLNEKIVEVSCGHKHVIVQSVVGKLYTWGLNSSFQLAAGDKKPRLAPVKFLIPGYNTLRCKIRSVQAGLTSTVVLLEDRQCYFAGLLGASKGRPAKTPTRLIYEEKVSSAVLPRPHERAVRPHPRLHQVEQDPLRDLCRLRGHPERAGGKQGVQG